MRIDDMFQPLSLGFMDYSRSLGLGQQQQQYQAPAADDDDDLMMDEDSREEGMGQADTNTNTSQRKAELRKSNKPIMEKKRRARINHCLNDLKGILLEAMRKDPARHSKLEKADILELTVRHLQNVQRNQLAIAMASDPTVLHRFKNGFSECLAEVNRYMGKLDGIDQGMRHRLTGHLSTCINGLQQVAPTVTAPPPAPIPVLPVPLSHFTPNIMVVPANLSSTEPIPSHHQPQTLFSQDMNNNTSRAADRQQFTSAFSIVGSLSRTPPPIQQQQSSSLLISPPTSSESDDGLSTSTIGTNLNNTSISSASDISISTGSEKGTNTSPNSFARARTSAGAAGEPIPIDFSLKFKQSPTPPVRVLKVEPIMVVLPDDPNEDLRPRRTMLGPKDKDNMWRPW